MRDDTKRQTESVQRHIAQGYRHIARQLEIIKALRAQGYPIEGAEQQLADLKRALQSHKARLARLQDSNSHTTR